MFILLSEPLPFMSYFPSLSTFAHWPLTAMGQKSLELVLCHRHPQLVTTVHNKHDCLHPTGGEGGHCSQLSLSLHVLCIQAVALWPHFKRCSAGSLIPWLSPLCMRLALDHTRIEKLVKGQVRAQGGGSLGTRLECWA